MKQEFHQYRTSNALEWDTMLILIRKLFRDGKCRMALLIGCGCFFGLRISDILTLTWSMLLDSDKFTIYEKKTGNRRVVKINRGFQRFIEEVHEALHIENEDEKCFLSRKKMVYSTQRINILFKQIKKDYNLKIDHFSTHSLRKTFGRKVYQSAGSDAPMALARLQSLFGHSSPKISLIYLGVTQKELESTYDLLDF